MSTKTKASLRPSSKTVIVDCDHTLFNTTALKERLRQSARKFGVSAELFDTIYQQIVSRVATEYGWDPIDQAQGLAQALDKPDLAGPLAHALEQVLEDVRGFIYQDVQHFLATLKKMGAILILVSRGYPNWQNKKIDASGIRQFFTRVIITPAFKKEVIASKIRKNDQIVLIDDNAAEIKLVRDNLPAIKIIQIIRPSGKYRQEADGALVVRTLGEALKYFKSSV